MTLRQAIGIVCLAIFAIFLVAVWTGQIHSNLLISNRFFHGAGLGLTGIWILVSGWNKVRMARNKKDSALSAAGIVLWFLAYSTAHLGYEAPKQPGPFIGQLFIYSWLIADLINIFLPSEDNPTK